MAGSTPLAPSSWLVNPLTLQAYHCPAAFQPTPGPTRLLGVGGQEIWADEASLHALALAPQEAREALQALLQQPGELAKLSSEWPVPAELRSLLGAGSAEEFVAALSQLAGTNDPAALEATLSALEANAAEAQRRLARGEGPELPELPSNLAPETHPQLLLLLALARAQDGTPEPAPDQPPVSRPVQVKVPEPQLDFSWENLSRGLSNREEA